MCNAGGGGMNESDAMMKSKESQGQNFDTGASMMDEMMRRRRLNKGKKSIWSELSGLY